MKLINIIKLKKIKNTSNESPLELNGDDKGMLIREYRDILKNKMNNKKISLEDHNIFIKHNKFIEYFPYLYSKYFKN